MRVAHGRVGARFIAIPFIAVLPIGVLACELGTGPEPTAGELIVFSGPPPGVAEDEGRELMAVRPTGTGLVILTTGAFAIAPAWSPDGSRLAFMTTTAGDGQIYVMDVDGSDPRAVTSGPGSRVHPTWSPDGETILFALDGAALYTVPAEGGDATLLHECEHGCIAPAWSPDDARIAFMSWPPDDPPDGVGSPKIMLLPLDGSDPVPLGTGLDQEREPAWSPDGDRLVFVGYARDSPFGVYTAGRTGNDLRLVVKSPGQNPAAAPAYSADGTRIVYEQMAFGLAPEPPGLYVVSANGTGRERIVEFPEPRMFLATPRWRPALP